MTKFLLALLVVGAGALVVPIVLWWLLPLAFPALSFSFVNALWLALLLLLLRLPAALAHLGD